MHKHIHTNAYCDRFLKGNLYNATVNMFADLHMLFTADYVIATFSSSVGRMVGEMRTAYELSDVISMDEQVYATWT